MKKKTLLIIITIFILFCFVVLLKGLSNSNTYVPNTKIGKQLLSFKAKKLFNNEEVISDELFFETADDVSLVASGIVPAMNEIKTQWSKTVLSVLEEATLIIPTNNWQFEGGRKGVHSEHLGFLLADLQYMQRAYPNMKW